MEDTRDFLRMHYRIIKAMFKHYATTSDGDWFSIKWMAFSDFCAVIKARARRAPVFVRVCPCGGDGKLNRLAARDPAVLYKLEMLMLMLMTQVIDNDKCTIKDIDSIFIATNVQAVTRAKMDLNPDRALVCSSSQSRASRGRSGAVAQAPSCARAQVRYEFLEVLCRLAMTKFVATKKNNSPADAVERLLREHVLPNAQWDDGHGFRVNVLWKEQVRQRTGFDLVSCV